MCVCVCVCVYVCVCVHSLNKDVSQAIIHIGTFYQCHFQKMVGWVSFYLIAILALHMLSHSLQERNVLGNVFIVDHRIKKNINIFLCDLAKRCPPTVCVVFA